jgi:hypothetical protein
MGFGLGGIALVKAGKVGQLTLCVGQVLVSAQHGGAETAALHLQQLVDQHITSGADFAGEVEPAAQQISLAESATVGEFGEIQLNAANAVQWHIAGVGIVRDLKGF